MDRFPPTMPQHTAQSASAHITIETVSPCLGAEVHEPTDMPYQSRPPAPLALRLVTLATVLVPFVGLVLAMVLLWHVAFSWVYLVLLGGMYVLTAIGVTVGFHRFFTHCSFKTSRPVVFVLGVLGSMAVQGPILTWVAVHRKHHQHSDDEGDPHSPHDHGGGIMGVLRGFVHAHMGWMFHSHYDDLARYIPDLSRDRLIQFMSRSFPLWVVLGFVIPAAVGGVLTGSWIGVLLGFMWGGLVRLFLGHHITWSINSVCHLWGSRPFRSNDESRNNAIFGILGFGEGWHNNHHAFPASARHGLRWWEIDLSYMIIKFMALVGLAHAVRVPSPERIAVKRTEHPAAALRQARRENGGTR